MTRLFAFIFIVFLTGPAAAQTSVALGDMGAQPGTPVQVDAQELRVDQASGAAVFSGDVLISQGDLRLGAAQVTVQYSRETEQITRLVAGGGVTFATASDAAEARDAVYDLAQDLLILTGDVLLSQGDLAISADRMEIRVSDGTAALSGHVRTVFGGR